jgi:polysaccharide deacetylase family protein (PEP-CTERM system associated)
MSVSNAFTVDLEDWYHGLTSTNRQPDLWPDLDSRIVDNTEFLLDLLATYSLQATFFVLGKVAEQHPNLVRHVAAAGHEIGVHGYAHVDTRSLTPEQFVANLDRTLGALAPLVSQPIIGYRAPYFSINHSTLWAFDVLAERGFIYDSSVFPTHTILYGYPRSPRFPHRLVDRHGLIEFPLSTVRLLGVTWPVGGGFYVRTLPYSVVHWAIKRLNRQGQPAILYVHPWELDIDQPMHAATPRERITHYCGRCGLETKLRSLFRDFKFVPLHCLLDRVCADF